MQIGGFQKLSLVDYPGKLAATVFLIGCNFRCYYCHNPELVNPDLIKKQPKINQKEFFDFLKKRKGFIDGICITGGEPTINKDLPDFIRKIKKMGFLVKLDTNGTNPEMVKKLLNENLLDFIAMDIKASVDAKKQKIKNKKQKYEIAVGVSVNIDKIKQSIDLIKNSKIDYEFRTTIVPGLVEKEDIENIAKLLKGAKKFALQQFRNKKVLDKKFEKIKPYPDKILNEFGEILKKQIEKVELRI